MFRFQKGLHALPLQLAFSSMLLYVCPCCCLPPLLPMGSATMSL